MKKLSFFLLCVFVAFTALAGNKGYFRSITSTEAPSSQSMIFTPKAYTLYRLDENGLKSALWNVSENPEEGVVVSLPMPDGSERLFKVWSCPIMPEELANKYPDIRTYSAEAVGDVRITAKLDFTCYGFHAMIFAGENTSFINPYNNLPTGIYFAHYKRDEMRTENAKMVCQNEVVEDLPTTLPALQAPARDTRSTARTGNGWQLRTYRLALSASHQYCAAATGLTTPTVAQALAKMTTSINRINGVYEREFSIHLNFVAKEDTLIWNVNTGGPNGNDPFNTINSNGTACLGANQTQCTNRIGTANFDLGHVFTTGGGGISGLGIVCNSTQKGRSVTGSPTPVGDGYDIDYVAHEMGHEFGSQHTFNNNLDGSCKTNAVSNYAYEPGSGTSIMAYAGICSPDDPAMHSEAYFHASSLKQIYTSLSTSEDVCATKTSTGNKLPYIAPFSANYIIPYKTPFELIAPTAVDSVADTANLYCWEQWNLGDFGSRITTVRLKGPLFRTYYPVYTTIRTFPKLSMLQTNSLSNAGIEGGQGEKVPDTARFLTFKLTARAIMNGKGTFNFPDDTIHIDTKSTGAAFGYAGFAVTSQGTTGITYSGGTPQTVTWNTVGTEAAPVSCANVNIYMSTDAGATWAYNLGRFPNNGTASVTIANPATTSTKVRLKVKGDNNIFFNINKVNFTVNHNAALPTTTSGVGVAQAPASAISLFPNPATDVLNITTATPDQYYITITQPTGKVVYQGSLASPATTLSTQNWAKGIYFVTFTHLTLHTQQVEKVVVE